MGKAVARADVPCLHLVESFTNGEKLLAAAARHHLEGVVSKAAPYRSGKSRDWRKVKTARRGARQTASGGGCSRKAEGAP